MKVLQPSALFDSTYIPPKILFRDDEQRTVRRLIDDATEDNFPLNLIVFGIRGVGKTVLGNFSLKKQLNQKIIPIYVDTYLKTEFEIIREIGSNLGIAYRDSQDIIWKCIQKISLEKPYKIVIMLDSINTQTNRNIAKIIRKIKDAHMHAFSVMNFNNYLVMKKDLKRRNLLDFILGLDTYTEKELMEITKQKIELAFPRELRREIIEFITDVVAEFDLARPATVVEILKMLYPVVSDGKDITAPLVRQAYDELEILGDDYFKVIEEFNSYSRLQINFLKLVLKHFEKTGKPYIKEDKLISLFQSAVIETQQGIVPSKFLSETLEFFQEDRIVLRSRINPLKYFIVYAPTNLLHILDSVVNSNDTENTFF